jgi:hypothetical protein
MTPAKDMRVQARNTLVLAIGLTGIVVLGIVWSEMFGLE